MARGGGHQSSPRSEAAASHPRKRTRSWSLAGLHDFERNVHRASRHSRLVRLLRIGIPTAIGFLIAALAALAWLNPASVLLDLPASAGKVVISGTKFIMEAPRMSGYTRDGRKYQVTAEAAAQDIMKPDILELNSIRGKLDAADGTAINLTAVSGVYDQKSEMLSLAQRIVVKSSSGYEAHLSEALVDTRKGRIESNKAVEVQFPQGVLNANGMQVTDNNELIRFTNGVSMVINRTSSIVADRTTK